MKGSPEARLVKEQESQNADAAIIVCGLGRFGLRIVELLRERDLPVTVISGGATRADRKNRAQRLGATLVEGDFRFPEVRQEAGVTSARGLILATADDQANLETALDAREESPQMRIVMRLDSHRIASRLSADFGIDAVLSPALLAARRFTQAAQEPAPAAPLSAYSGSLDTPRSLGKRRRRFRASPVPSLLLLALIVLFCGGVVVFHAALDVTWIDAVYFTASILSTVGFGDINLHYEPNNVKLFGTLLMFGGVTLIAVFSSFLTNFFISGAATQLRAERITSRYRNHIILCGLGSVGYEIATDLFHQRSRFVIVDSNPEDMHVRDVANRVPLIIGNAADPDTLIRAGFDRARAVIVAVSNDATNLEIGLLTQSLVEERRRNRPLRIVLRCFDADLARRIHARSAAYTLLSSAEIAAPIFVEEALK